jgi:hypothetical protein
MCISLIVDYNQFNSSHIGNSENKEFTKICPPNDPLVSVSNLDKITIVRFAADSTEDAYILLAEILKPLSSGLLYDLPQPYADRIHTLKKNNIYDSNINSISTANTCTSTANTSNKIIDTANINSDDSNKSLLSIDRHNCNIEKDTDAKLKSDINLIGKKRSFNDTEYDDNNYSEITIGTAISALMKYDEINAMELSLSTQNNKKNP